MTSWRLLLILTGAALWGGHAEAANPDTAPRPRIVILGDSITAGYGLDPADAYPALLQKKINAAGLPFEVINAGLSGDTTSGGLRRLDWSLKSGAAVLVIALGGNDGLRGLAPAQTQKNLEALIGKAREKIPGLAVVIAGMEMPANLGENYVREFKAVFAQVAGQTHAILLPFLLEGVGGVSALNQADQIHPTAEGQKVVAENVWKILAPLLKEKKPAAP